MKNWINKISKRLLWVAWLLPATAVSAQTDSLSLLFVGDLMQHKRQIEVASRPDGSFDYSTCFRDVSSEIRKADLAIANWEVTLGGKPYTGYPAFSAPDEFLLAARKAGFDVFLTANNHCLDRRGKGLVRTLDKMDSLRVFHTGTFRNQAEREREYPLLVERKGFRIVFLNYTYGTNGIPVTSPNVVNYINRSQIRNDVLRARLMKPDAIIACMHWGIEYRLLPEQSERELAEYLLSLGVDHVIGSHPHVLQPIEVIDNAKTPERHVVAYSLGNFISNMSQRYTDGGAMLKLVLKKVNGKTRLADCGYTFVWTSRPNLNGKNQFLLYPSNKKELNGLEKNKMFLFLQDARNLYDKHNKGIKEYFLE